MSEGLFGDKEEDIGLADKYFDGVPALLPISIFLVAIGGLTVVFFNGGQTFAVPIIAVGASLFLVGRGIYYGLSSWLAALTALVAGGLALMLAISPPSFVTDAMNIYVPVVSLAIIAISAIYAGFFAGEEEGY